MTMLIFIKGILVEVVVVRRKKIRSHVGILTRFAVHFVLSCKFDHRCSVRKCGKFGHGAHVFRLRNSQSIRNESFNTGGDNVSEAAKKGGSDRLCHRKTQHFL